jgi:hypothetical protein
MIDNEIVPDEKREVFIIQEDGACRKIVGMTLARAVAMMEEESDCSFSVVDEDVYNAKLAELEEARLARRASINS